MISYLTEGGGVWQLYRITIGQGVVVLLMTYLGFHVSIHPIESNIKTIRKYQAAFVICGVLMIGLIGWQAFRNNSETAHLRAEIAGHYDFPPRKLRNGNLKYAMGGINWINQKTPILIDGDPFIWFTIKEDYAFLNANIYDENGHVVLAVTNNEIVLNKNNSFSVQTLKHFFQVKNQKNEIALEVSYPLEDYLAIRGTTYSKGTRIKIIHKAVSFQPPNGKALPTIRLNPHDN